jgi:anti-sigma regulatory factor (Ser/Thr protein kinase)
MGAITELPAEALWATVRSLPIAPKAAATARAFAAEFLASVKLDDGHIDDVVLVISELITNAVKYGGDGQRNINLEVGIWSKWTLITVDDRDPQVYEAAPERDNDLCESGRGLFIVCAYAERFWWRPLMLSKTANAAVLRPGVKLTDEDNAILDHLEAGG